MDDTPPHATHDIGGVSAFLCLPVDTAPHALDGFEREVDAVRQVLGAKGVMSVDVFRRHIESLPEAEYFALSYYQRWLRAIVALLAEKGVVTLDELRDEAGRAP